MARPKQGSFYPPLSSGTISTTGSYSQSRGQSLQSPMGMGRETESFLGSATREKRYQNSREGKCLGGEDLRLKLQGVLYPCWVWIFILGAWGIGSHSSQSETNPTIALDNFLGKLEGKHQKLFFRILQGNITREVGRERRAG